MLQCPLKRQPTKPNVKGDAGLDCSLGVGQGGVGEDDGAASTAVVEGSSFSQIQLKKTEEQCEMQYSSKEIPQ
jgi:hypothetical protein